MFHLCYSKSRGFLTWDELGCLSRSLGFQVDLFPSNVTDEIIYDEKGLPTEEVYRVLEYKLLHKALHLTYNIHTDTWNVAALKKAVSLVEHKAFTFEQLHCIRVAYQLYEEQDSKGMLVQQKVILRALKMCGRTIAPLKLMHRLKHMKGDFVEPGRIQLDEFLGLLLWCDTYEEFNTNDLEFSRGMDKDLFKLVSFERMLSHHDGRMADRLNTQYLAEEWDFGRETLGSKKMSKEPPVNDQIRLREVEKQRESYTPLKNEVDQSQQRVYRSRVGFIRPRPLTAPDLSRHGQTTASSYKTNGDTLALSVYDIIRRLRLKPARLVSFEKSELAVQEQRFQTTPVKRTPMASVVTPQDVADAAAKMDDVMFQMETLDTRYEHETEREIQFLLPKYVPAANPGIEPETSNPPEENEVVKLPQKSVGARINDLVYPTRRGSVSHTKNCDARHRGWLSTNTKTGHHYVLTSQTFGRSPQARLHERLMIKSAREVRHLHGDYIHRHTPTKSPQPMIPGKQRRPSTAPSLIRSNQTHPSSPSRSSSRCSSRSASSKGRFGIDKTEQVDNKSTDDDTEKVSVDEQITKIPQGTCTLNDPEVITPLSSTEQPNPNQIPNVEAGIPATESSQSPDNPIMPISEQGSNHNLVGQDSQRREAAPPGTCFHKEPPVDVIQDSPSPPALIKPDLTTMTLPVPFMEHSKAAVVEVGQMGKISLLENIAEAKFYESVGEDGGNRCYNSKGVLGSGKGEPSKEYGLKENVDESETETMWTGKESPVLQCAVAEMPEAEISSDHEEERKLRAIARLRIYTHRLTKRNSGKRRKRRSPIVEHEQTTATRVYPLSTGSNSCGRDTLRNTMSSSRLTAHASRKLISV